MASLSDLTSGAGAGLPDAAATLITKFHSSKGSHEYTTSLAAGKYVVKHNHGEQGKLKLSTPKAEVQVWQDDHAIIDIPEATSRLKIDFESDTVFSGTVRRELRRFYIGGTGTTNWQGTVGYSNPNMIASDPTGKIWIACSGYQGGSIRRSEDGGKTWSDIGRMDYLAGTGNTYYENWTVNYFQGKFIISAGPAETGTAIVSGDGYSWQQAPTTLTTVTTAAVNTAKTIYVAGRRTTTNQLVWSVDGINFTQVQAPGLTGAILYVYHDGTRFLAFTNNAQLTTSIDGFTWTTATTLPVSIRSIVLVNGTYYAITEAGVVYTTTNLTAWTLVATISTASHYNHMLQSLGNTIVYYDPNNGKIRTSTDGVNWVDRITGMGTYGTIAKVYNGTADQIVFFQSDRSDFYRSTDGLDWNWRPTVVQGNTITGLAYGAGLHVATGSNLINTTTDGWNWTARTSNTGQAIQALTFANGKFVYAANSGNIGTSTDGINWVLGTSNFGTVQITAVAYGNNRWIAVGNSGSQFITSDDNAATWTSRTTMNTPSGAYGIAYSPANAYIVIPTWVVVGSSGVINRSLDNGNTWTRVDNVFGNTKTPWGETRLFTNNYTAVTYGNGKFVAVGDRVIAYSTDGANWVVRNENTYHHTGVWRGVEYNPDTNRFYAYGDTGLSAYSTDGIVWYSQPNGMNTQAIYSYSYGGGKHLFGGSSGVVRESTDGEYWWHSYWDFNPSTNYNAVRGKGLEYTFTNAAGLWRTTDFKNFKDPVYNRVAGSESIGNIIYGNGVYVGRAVSSQAIYFSPNGLNWAVAESQDGLTDVRGHNVIYADGYFWKIWKPNSQSKLSRSVDGRTWKDYYGWRNENQAPQWIKKVQGFYIAFGWTTGNQQRYFHFSDNLLTNPDLWHRGDVGFSASWSLTDIDGVDGMWVYTMANSSAYVSPSLYGRNQDGGSSQIINANGSSGPNGAYHAFTVGDRIYINNGGNLYEVRRESDQYNATNTNWAVMARSWWVGNWGNQDGYYYMNYGNGVIGANGNQVYELKSAVPTTFSIYNSTINVVN